MPVPDRWDGWTFYQGSNWLEKVQYTNGDGSVRNLTGAVASMEVRTRPYGLLLAVVTIAITAATGVLTLSVASSVTRSLNADSLSGINEVWFDLYVTESGGDRTCILYGLMPFFAEVTQS